MAWLPQQDVGGENHTRSDELRIRASNLELAGLEALRPLAAKLSPVLGEIWQATQPSGKIATLALDIPLQATEKTRFQASWKNLAWKQWKLFAWRGTFFRYAGRKRRRRADEGCDAAGQNAL
ncbi:Uncharacterised protein [Salmonella enterica subsp. arizonae]|uniref:YhdP central domain-containing protein n=1 Tax=Salmonella enterica subsp. arizonae TaxID=59203 RepID=A0A2X4SXG9_SALER|nr:Uncharacterised protein [Salmonella enterica subsp. arizonae]